MQERGLKVKMSVKSYEQLSNKDKIKVYVKYFGVLTINLCLVGVSIYYGIWLLTILFLFSTFIFAFPSIVNKWIQSFISNNL